MITYLAVVIVVLVIMTLSLAVYAWRQRDKALGYLVRYRQGKKALYELEQEINFLQGEPLAAKVKQGKGGRWRFEIDNLKGQFLAGAPPNGWSTRQEAVGAAVKLFPGRIQRGI